MAEFESRTEYGIAGQKAPYRLFPLPVIKGKKFFIETQKRSEAELLQNFLAKSWLKIDMQNPSESSGGFWQEQEVHADGKTRIFQVDWNKLHLQYLPFAGKEAEKAEALQKVMSREISAWVLASDVSDRSNAKTQIEKRIVAQKGCKHCQTLGINEVNFDFLDLAL